MESFSKSNEFSSLYIGYLMTLDVFFTKRKKNWEDDILIPHYLISNVNIGSHQKLITYKFQDIGISFSKRCCL